MVHFFTFWVLGGDRIYDQPLAGPGEFGPVILGQNSLITSVSPTEILVSGRYPMQRSTSPQVYLRCDLPNDNIETSSLNRVGHSSDSTLSSNILGCFQMDHEYTHYDLLGDEHFLNLRGNNLSHMKLFLTDRKTRWVQELITNRLLEILISRQ